VPAKKPSMKNTKKDPTNKAAAKKAKSEVQKSEFCNPCWHKSAKAWTIKYRKSSKQALSVS
jgi:hypothetical protein